MLGSQINHICLVLLVFLSFINLWIPPSILHLMPLMHIYIETWYTCVYINFRLCIFILTWNGAWKIICSICDVQIVWHIESILSKIAYFILLNNLIYIFIKCVIILACLCIPWLRVIIYTVVAEALDCGFYIAEALDCGLFIADYF